MMPKLPWWMIPLIAPLAWGARLRQNPFLLQIAINYTASASRVLSWLIVSAIVYRSGGAYELGLLMLLRGTVGLFSYASFGLTPTLVQMLAKPVSVNAPDTSDAGSLEYERARTDESPILPRQVIATAIGIMHVTSLIAGGLIVLYALNATWLHGLPPRHNRDVATAVLAIGAAVLVRLYSDVVASRLHAERRLSTDALCQIAGEAAFVGFTALSLMTSSVNQAAIGMLIGNGVVLVARASFAMDSISLRIADMNTRLLTPLLAGGAFVVLAQLADWLYAPVNQILIGRFLGVASIGVYVPTLQVDAAMLLLVSGLATVLFPYAAIAMHAKRYTDLRIIYVGGTILSLVILTVGAIVICLIDGWLFQKWFGDPLPATQAILPLVMVHTVAGGSASIGRAVLFGMGKFKAYAISAVLGGVANVVLAILLLSTTSLGLHGIIYATIITVVVRCLLWMPAYTLWSIYKVGGPMRFRWH